jgi:hypothetical protein
VFEAWARRCRQVEIVSGTPSNSYVFHPPSNPERSSVTAKVQLLLVYLRHAQAVASLLRCRLCALYHHQLLPAIAAAGHFEEPRSVSSSAGAGAATLSVRGPGIRGDARARALADGRAATRRSVGGDEGSEARVCASPAFALPS